MRGIIILLLLSFAYNCIGANQKPLKIGDTSTDWDSQGWDVSVHKFTDNRKYSDDNAGYPNYIYYMRKNGYLVNLYTAYGKSYKIELIATPFRDEKSRMTAIDNFQKLFNPIGEYESVMKASSLVTITDIKVENKLKEITNSYQEKMGQDSIQNTFLDTNQQKQTKNEIVTKKCIRCQGKGFTYGLSGPKGKNKNVCYLCKGSGKVSK